MVNNFISDPEWPDTAFKILASNDTRSAPGHQGGIVIPKGIRQIFPPLKNKTSAANPTVDIRIKADLYEGQNFLSTVNTRYQFQTWGGVRSPEARLTDRLGPIREIAEGGDLILIQRNQRASLQYRLILVQKNSKEFRRIRSLIGNKRWGPLPLVY